jgi:hypothetical protein
MPYAVRLLVLAKWQSSWPWSRSSPCLAAGLLPWGPRDMRSRQVPRGEVWGNPMSSSFLGRRHGRTPWSQGSGRRRALLGLLHYFSQPLLSPVCGSISGGVPASFATCPDLRHQHLVTSSQYKLQTISHLWPCNKLYPSLQCNIFTSLLELFQDIFLLIFKFK